MTRQVYHNPKGNPCIVPGCGLLPQRHRVKHVPEGEPCGICGLGLGNHRKRSKPPRSQRAYYIGIDGEGQGRADHRYVMLAWSNESSSRRDAIEAPDGGRLTTKDCLDFILDTPNDAKIFSYAFNYDITKILTDVDDEIIFKLMRPELRQYSVQQQQQHKYRGPREVKWQGYRLNLMASKLTIRKGARRRVVWDVFKFFQASFVNALRDWKVGDKAVIDRMQLMKEQRHEFDKLDRQSILEYCYGECALMAQLARRLTEAAEEAGLQLRSYFGAGSVASAILKKMNIDKCNRVTPDELVEPVARAFFGGRFEHDIIGPIPGPVYGYDISSAYPYQLCFLPCLDCGKWTHTKNRKHLERGTTALVEYRLGKPPRGMHWAPFPFRLKTGSIAFPATSGGGWIWREEYLQGERLFPHVEFVSAWIYQTDCDHRPFEDIPHYYRQRLRIGKEGPGIVLKLGTNACYGKLAQSAGLNPPFQCWIWAGMITSGTRAQILELLGLHKKRSNMLIVATDGIYSREKIETPRPRDTGTFDAADKDSGIIKPLGAWERKIVEAGMFAARPGVYFPLGITNRSEIKQVRGRGVGRAAMYDARDAAIAAFNNGADRCEIKKVARFYGAKTSIGRIKIIYADDMPPEYNYKRHIDINTGNPRYGQWADLTIQLTFNPLPKRENIRPDKTLTLRSFPGEESAVYKRTTLNNLIDKLLREGPLAVDTESIAMKQALIEALEQPDGVDFADYDSEP